MYRPFLLLIFLGNMFCATAQDSVLLNQQVIQQLGNDFKQRPSRPTGKLSGEGAMWFQPWETDTSGVSVQVGMPVIRYEKLDTVFSRKAEVTVSWTDSIPQGTILRYSDTLTLGELRQVMRGSDTELQGDDPRWKARWMKPALWIAGSLTAILTLFYLRSTSR